MTSQDYRRTIGTSNFHAIRREPVDDLQAMPRGIAPAACWDRLERSEGCEDHRAERLKQMLVQLADHLLHDRKRPGVGMLDTKGALLNQCRVDIRDRYQAHDVADLIAAETVGISGAVKEFMMVQDHIQHLRREAALGCEHLIAATGMLANFVNFRLGQLSRLVQNR